MAERYTNRELARKLEDISSEQKIMKDKLDILNDFMVVMQDRENREKPTKADWPSVLKQALVVVGIAITSVASIVIAFVQVYSK